MTAPEPAAEPGPRFDEFRALFINCTLKRSPELSHTEGLLRLSVGIMRRRGVQVECYARSTTILRPVCGQI